MIYHSVKETIKTVGGAFLVKDLELLRDASQESGKYQFVLENKVAPFIKEISTCIDAQIIYIVPGSIEGRTQPYADRVLTFGSLSNTIKSPFAQEWRVIQKHLCKLDNLSQRTRNHQRLTTVTSERFPTLNRQKNWEGTFKFEEMVKFCQAHGDEIIIGFNGGKSQLATKSLSYLENRLHYKWDYVNNIAGKKLSDWISGSQVIRILRRHNKYPTE